jgi:hypothetical protein
MYVIIYALKFLAGIASEGYKSKWMMVIVVATFIYSLLGYMVEMWSVALARLASLTLDVPTANLICDVLSFANFYFPVTEICALASAYCAALLASVTVRSIKAWIPTLS